MTKEKLIDNIILAFVDILGIENSNKVKDILTLEMRNVRIEEQETALVPKSDERAYIIQKFIACKKLAGCTERTLKAYLMEYYNFFKVINKNIEDVNVDDIRYYLAISRRNGVTEATVDNRRRYLNTFFDWCLSEELITKNPVKKVEKVRIVKKEKEAFNDIEIEKMRSYLNNDRGYLGTSNIGHETEVRLRDIAIFETLLSTGMRVCELVSINREQVENDADEFVILGKGKKERKVYLNARAKISIQNYLKHRKDTDECLFLSYDNFSKSEPRRMSIAGVETMIRNCGKHCGTEAYPHKFRRTSATIAVRKGMPIEQVQKMLGHASLNTTQIYVKVSDDEVKRSHEKYLS